MGQNRARVFDSRARRRLPFLVSFLSLPFLVPSTFPFSSFCCLSFLFSFPSSLLLFSFFHSDRIQFHRETIDFFSPYFQSHNHVFHHVPLFLSSLHLLRFIFCSQFNECFHQQKKFFQLVPILDVINLVPNNVVLAKPLLIAVRSVKQRIGPITKKNVQDTCGKWGWPISRKHWDFISNATGCKHFVLPISL